MASNDNHQTEGVQTVRTYCAQCFSNCPVVAHIENGKFSKVLPDYKHEFYRPVCQKSIAGPELVYNSQRLEYPMKRTNPKGADDPGWKRITWEEALNTIAWQMKKIKSESGAEAFVFSQTNVSSPLWELTSFIRRLANVYGTPNHMTTTHICNWHRDVGSALTFGKPGDMFSAGWPDFERSRCILIWGHNPKSTINAFHRHISSARKKGAKIIVVDPRKTEIASQADIWLQVKPATDGALALSMIQVMLEEKLYDATFVRNWTNAPFLVRTDTGSLLRATDVVSSEAGNNVFYCIDEDTNKIVMYKRGQHFDYTPALNADTSVRLSNGKMVTCKTVFTLLKESVSLYHPKHAEKYTSIAQDDIYKIVHTIAENSPSSWFAFNGIEQNINATQTNRAICIFYALTGDYDRQGGNVINSPFPPLNYPYGFEFITHDMFAKNLALSEHPLGPAGSILSVPPYVVCKSIEEAVPYKTRGLLVFGANTISANPDSAMIANALKKLEFHAHMDLFMNPTAEFADIVLPATSFWEAARIGYPLIYQDNKWVLQWREPVAAPRGESKDELWVIFELAKRLGFSNKFWNGDIEAAFEAMLQPVGITLDELKKADGGIFFNHPITHMKYKTEGFDSMTGKIEIFSQNLKDISQSPLPEWQDPFAIFRAAGINESNYPYLLINSKLREYCQSQHRCIPSLRKKHPYPALEINKTTAERKGIKDGSEIVLETVHGHITLRAKLTENIAQNVVCTQHGWWQACPELGLPGHDIYSSDGANVNLLYKNDFVDPISGSVHMRGFPCNVKAKN